MVVDQFEELFAEGAEPAAQQAFIRALCIAARGAGAAPTALVVFGVRADFFGRCAASPNWRRPCNVARSWSAR